MARFIHLSKQKCGCAQRGQPRARAGAWAASGARGAPSRGSRTRSLPMRSGELGHDAVTLAVTAPWYADACYETPVTEPPPLRVESTGGAISDERHRLRAWTPPRRHRLGVCHQGLRGAHHSVCGTPVPALPGHRPQELRDRERVAIRQSAIIYAAPETQGQVHLYEIATGKVLEARDRLHPKMLSAYFSRLHEAKAPHALPNGRPVPMQRAFMRYPLSSLSEGLALRSYIRRAREYLAPSIRGEGDEDNHRAASTGC